MQLRLTPWRSLSGSCPAALVVALAACPGSFAAQRPFTVVDSIELTKVIDPTYTSPQLKCATGANRKCVYVTMRGRLSDSRNEYSLLLVDPNEIERAFQPARANIAPRAIAHTTTETTRDGIDRVQWTPDGTRLLYIQRGEKLGAGGQIFSYEARTRKIRQLTHHNAPIVDFSTSRDGTVVVFAALAERPIREKFRAGYVVTNENVREVSAYRPEDLEPENRYFSLNTKTGAVLALPHRDSNPRFQSKIFVSPPGNRVVLLESIKKLPKHWARYEAIKSRWGVDDSALTDHDTPETDTESFSELDQYGGRFDGLWRHVLIDLNSGSESFLADAPVLAPGGVLWAPDGAKVLLTAIYAPISLCPTNEDSECLRNDRNVISVDIEKHEASVVPLKSLQEIKGARTSYEWISADSIRITKNRRLESNSTTQDLTFDNRQWVAIGSPQVRPLDDNALTLRLEQSMNTSPDIIARDKASGKNKNISDLNPQLSKIDLGRLEVFNWRNEKLGQDLSGGLLYPPDYAPNKKYPVVIQDYGFLPSIFFVNGPSDTAYAGRALAARGMFVLTLGCWGPEPMAPDTPYSNFENPRSTACLESAIDALVKSGLADRERIGLIGFSHTGMHVMDAVTFSPYPIAAATIADSIANTPSYYVTNYADARPLLSFWDSGPGQTAEGPYIGAKPFSDGWKLWFERSPLFNLDKIRAAIRYEYVGIPLGTPPYWDVYAILKRMKRPIEMIRLPEDEHSLKMPYRQFMSRQGNVDWYAFWLLGEERSAPIAGAPETAGSLADQYKRWRLLRDQRDTAARK